MDHDVQLAALQLITLIVNGVLIPMVGTVLRRLDVYERRIRRIETHLKLPEEIQA